MTQSGGYGIEGHCGISQPLLWLPTASLYCKEQSDIIYLGYHKGDDFWQFKHESELAIQNFLLVMEKKDIKIEYPLQLYTKADIIKQLKAKGLYDYCWYCEAGADENTEKPCGKCFPCLTHQTALMQIEKGLDVYHENSIPDFRIPKKDLSLIKQIEIPFLIKDCVCKEKVIEKIIGS